MGAGPPLPPSSGGAGTVVKLPELTDMASCDGDVTPERSGKRTGS